MGTTRQQLTAHLHNVRRHIGESLSKFSIIFLRLQVLHRWVKNEKWFNNLMNENVESEQDSHSNII